MFRAVVAVVGLTTLSTGAALAQERVDPEVVRRVEEEAFGHSEVMDHLDYLTNVIGPRLTATPAFKRAADWASSRLEGWGLSNVHQEPWEFGRGWTLEGLTLEMTAPRYFPLIGYPEAWTPSTDGMVEGAPVYVGDWTEDDLTSRAGELRGRVVLAAKPQEDFLLEDRPQPSSSDESVRIGAPRTVPTALPAGRRTVELLQAAGAAAVLRPNQGRHGTIFVLGRRDTPDDAVPTVVLASEHYNLMVRALEAGEPVRVRVGVRVAYHEEDTNGYNVIAEIPGTDPEIGDEVVMVGAHLDSWHSATGATDNADGVASLMEAMRILRTLGVRPRRTIRMALWGGEEEGLLGSRAYVARHYGPDQSGGRERLAVYLNDDPGTDAIRGWYMEDNRDAKAIFDGWLASLTSIGARKNVIEGIGSTDHVSFIEAGLPGFNTIQDYVDYDVRTHHTNTDFYERLDARDLQEASAVLAVFLYQAAMRDGKIPRKPIS